MRLNQSKNHFCHCEDGISKTRLLDAQQLSPTIKTVNQSVCFSRLGSTINYLVSIKGCKVDERTVCCFDRLNIELFVLMMRVRIVMGVIRHPYFAVDFCQTNDCVPF